MQREGFETKKQPCVFDWLRSFKLDNTSLLVFETSLELPLNTNIWSKGKVFSLNWKVLQCSRGSNCKKFDQDHCLWLRSFRFLEVSLNWRGIQLYTQAILFPFTKQTGPYILHVSFSIQRKRFAENSTIKPHITLIFIKQYVLYRIYWREFLISTD